MPSQDDRTLIAGEPHLPGLAVVLDSRAVAEAIATSSGREATSIGAGYARYKPATSCVVGHRICVDGEVVDCVAKAFRPVDRAKLDKAVLKAVRDPRTGCGVLADHGTVTTVSTIVNDRSLPAMAVLAEPRERARLLARVMAVSERDAADLAATVRTIRYKPERRWVGVVDVDGEPVCRIKAYRTGDFERALAGHAAMAGVSGPIGWSRRRAVVAGRWVHGTSLAELLGQGDVTAIELVGQRLAELHGRPVDRHLEPLRPFELRRAARTAADAVAAILPDLAGSARKVARRAARQFVDGPRRVPLHGDFSADQVIWSGSDVHFIDFDESRMGDPIVDLASFVADLHRLDLDGRLGVDVQSVVSSLLESYVGAGGPARFEAIDAHIAAALLRRAVSPFRERRPDWSRSCREMVETAMGTSSGRSGRRAGSA